MKLIAKNDQLIAALTDTETMLDGKLTRLNIYEDLKIGLIIEVYINLLHSKKQNEIVIRFLEVEEYIFYYSNSSYFYYIERCKFFASANKYYLSLDPYDEKEVVNQQDQDFILSKSIEGYRI
jgi:hypothetical protein